MSCYFRHLKDVFQEAGIEVTPANKRQLDQAVHRMMGVHYKDCPQTWQKLKEELARNGQKRQELIQGLQAAVQQTGLRG
ncbi:MAG: hypothetical protein ACOC6A_05180 [Chloroflexota bacterium]